MPNTGSLVREPSKRCPRPCGLLPVEKTQNGQKAADHSHLPAIPYRRDPKEHPRPRALGLSLGQRGCLAPPVSSAGKQQGEEGPRRDRKSLEHAHIHSFPLSVRR